MKNKEKEILKTDEIIKRLSVKYASPNFGFLTQVRNGTGYKSDRTIDAMAMSLWPSRGLHIYGFEVKASRGDWLGELKKPEKAEAMAKYCHYWYLVVGHEEIIKDDELPKNWGLIVPHGNGLKIKKEAEFNENAVEFDYLMLAGIFRNIADHCVPKEVVDIEIKKGVESGIEAYKGNVEYAEKEKEKIKDVVDDFESKTGLSLSIYNKDTNADLIEAIKLALKGGEKIKTIENKLSELKTIGDNIGKYVDGELESYQL